MGELASGEATEVLVSFLLLLCARLTPLTSTVVALLEDARGLLLLLLLVPVGYGFVFVPKKSILRRSVRAMSGGGTAGGGLRLEVSAAVDRSLTRVEVEGRFGVSGGAAATSCGLIRGMACSGAMSACCFALVEPSTLVPCCAGFIADLPLTVDVSHSLDPSLPAADLENSLILTNPSLAPPNTFLGATIGLTICLISTPAASGAISAPTALLLPCALNGRPALLVAVSFACAALPDLALFSRL